MKILMFALMACLLTACNSSGKKMLIENSWIKDNYHHILQNRGFTKNSLTLEAKSECILNGNKLNCKVHNNSTGKQVDIPIHDEKLRKKLKKRVVSYLG